LRFIPRKGRPPLLVKEYKTKGGKLKREDIMYVLKRTIKMPKRLRVNEDWKSWGIKTLFNRTRGVYRKFLKFN